MTADRFVAGLGTGEGSAAVDSLGKTGGLATNSRETARMNGRQSETKNERDKTGIEIRTDALGERMDGSIWQGSRRRFLGATAGIAGVSTASLFGSGHSVVAAQEDQWTDPPGIEREFTFDTGGPIPEIVQYEHDDDPSEERFDLSGTASAGPDGNATGVWSAEYDGQGTELYSVTIYDPDPGYPTWNSWFLQSASGQEVFLLGEVEDTGGNPAALYAARIENETDIQWTTTFAADIDWTDDRLSRYSFSTSFDYTADPPVVKFATGGSSDPVAHDDWIADGTVTRNITVSDPNIDRVDAVSHDTGKPWLYLVGTGTDGGVFAQAASPDDQAEWRTSLAEFGDETFLAGAFNTLSEGASAYVIASDAAGSGDWIKTVDTDGTVVDSATFSPPSGGESAVRALRWYLGTWEYFTIGPTSDGSWLRSIADDLSVQWTTTLDGFPRWVQGFGGSDSEGYLVRGRRGDAPAFWRLAADGTVQWDVSLGNNPEDFLFPINVGPENALVLGGRRATGNAANPWLVRIDPTDGTVDWQETYGGAAWGDPSFPQGAGDGLLFADRGNSSVEVLDLSPAVDRDPGGGDGPPPIVGNDPPQDLDDDGLYEDINGNGELTFTDVEQFFENRDSDVVQDNAEFFNFDEREPAGVSVGDTQALFQLFSDQNETASGSGGDR
jgi:hypothetical protein